MLADSKLPCFFHCFFFWKGVGAVELKRMPSSVHLRIMHLCIAYREFLRL